MQIYAAIHLHDSVQLGTSLQAELSFFLQSAKLQLANLLQNCYFCLIQKTISNSLLWSLIIKFFLVRLFCAPCLLRPGATAPSAPPLLRHWQNRPDSFPHYPPDNHHISDDVYLREGGVLQQAADAVHRLNRIAFSRKLFHWKQSLT